MPDPSPTPAPGRPSTPEVPRRVGRRVVLGGVLTPAVGIVLAACSAGDRTAGAGPTGAPSAAGPSGTPSAGTSSGDGSDNGSDNGSDTDADRQLVARARRELSLAHAIAQRQATLSPSLRVPLTSFARLHARHAQSLGGLVAVSRREIARVAPATEDGLRSSERRLQDQLTGLAVGASSGALAARLASMAAAVAQRVSLL